MKRALGVGAFASVSIALAATTSLPAFAAPHAAAAQGANQQSPKPHVSHHQSAEKAAGTGPRAKATAAPGHAKAAPGQAKKAPPPAPGAVSPNVLVSATNPSSAQPVVPSVAAAGSGLVSSNAQHTSSLPPGPRLLAHNSPKPPAPIENEPMILSAGGWHGVSLQAAVDLRIPILFGAAVLLFVLLQALVDRRDPKVSRAPERGDDDTVGFT